MKVKGETMTKFGTFSVVQDGYMGDLLRASFNRKRLRIIPVIPQNATKKRTKKGDYIYTWRGMNPLGT
jgi:hypothetical protein